MHILGIETSGDTSSVALLADGEVVAEHIFPSRRTICQILVRQILELLGTETVRAADLDGVTVSVGPASFTGLRVGVTTAKTIAYCCRIPAVGVSTPLAWAVEADAPSGSTIMVLQPARRNRLYLTPFSQTGTGTPQQQADTKIIDTSATPEACAQTKRKPIVITGNALLTEPGIIAALADRAKVVAPKIDSPHASTIARLGAEKLDEAPADSCFTLRPNYVLVSQAERVMGVNIGL